MPQTRNERLKKLVENFNDNNLYSYYNYIFYDLTLLKIYCSIDKNPWWENKKKFALTDKRNKKLVDSYSDYSIEHK